MRKKTVTLYIDDNSIRLLVVQGKKIKKWAETSLEPGLIEGTVVMNEVEVTSRIKKLFKDNKVNAGKVILGLSGLNCFTRPVTLPLIPKAMLSETVMRVAANTLPLSLDQLYIMWHALPAPPGKTQVFLAAIRRKVADSMVGMLQRAGIKPYIIDIKPLALARLVHSFTAVIIDVQATEFDIVVMVNGICQPIRTISFPREELSLEQKVSLVKEDVERTIKFYNSNNPETPLSSGVPIYVSGELSQRPEMCQSLSRELGFPVSVLSSKLETPQTDLSYYMVNMGLVLREQSLAKITGPSVANINFLPLPYRPKPVPLIKVVAIPATVVVAILIVPVFALLQSAAADADALRGELEATNQLIAQKQQEKKDLNASIVQLEKEIKDAQDTTDKFALAVSSLEVQQDTMNGDLGITMTETPANVTLTRIDHSDDKLIIDGQASDEQQVFAYSRNLDASGRFSEVYVASITRGDQMMDFSLILKVK